MPDLNGTIDVVLGFVTIVLVLSLIIQSVQNVIKRLLRMKSRQAEQSLRLLFDYVLTKAPTKYTEMRYASPIMSAVTRFLGGAGKDGDKDGVGGALVEEVKRHVREMGRKSFWGTALLDSVTKEDLSKILTSLDVERLDQPTKDAINGKIGEVEAWYDTVMPGLSERYERGMKWMAVLISAVVVALFNADAIRVYRYVASDSAVQQQLAEYGENYLKQKSSESQKAGAARTDTAAKPDAGRTSGAAANSNSPENANTAQNSNTAANSNSTAQSNAAAGSNTARNSNIAASSNTAANTDARAMTGAERKEAEDQLKAEIAETQRLYSEYRKFGLKPFNWAGSFVDYRTGWRTLLGWLVMTLLLSLGAPFWEDALESLFGLKNTLRGKAKAEEKRAQQSG